ncbi:MAG TPA: DUF2802 domain-containing protein [Pseudomonadales bacterium]|nr:DUF2802 domain-containing protein [Pseudomonadales bacterium]
MVEYDIAIITGSASAVLLLAFIAGLSIAQVKRVQRQVDGLKGELSDLKRQVTTVNRGTLGVGQHLSALEKRLLSGLNKVEQQSLKEMSMLSYGDAARLIEQGVDADVLVKRCGMSRGEAELMCKLRQSA